MNYMNTKIHALTLVDYAFLSLQSLNQLYTPIFSITHTRKCVEATVIFIDSFKCKQNFKPTLLIQSFRFLLHAVILFGASIVFARIWFPFWLEFLPDRTLQSLYLCNIYGVCTIWLTGYLFIEYFPSIANTC